MKDIPIPKRMQKLKRDSKGRIVPYFVAQDGPGDPDFRVADPEKRFTCYKFDMCWVCGQKMGVYKCFVAGPMCCINRSSSEPASHYDCALYSVRVCPFLTTPRMHRRETDMPEGWAEPGGIAIMRNPGATAIWVTRAYTHLFDGMGSFIFRMGPAERVEWFAEGRAATRQEVLDSIESGYPLLLETAKEDGPLAVRALEIMRKAVDPLLPKETYA
jgi:hypothetical protein